MLLPELIILCRDRCEKLLDKYITNYAILPSILKKSMGYSVLNGGKRIRPLMVYATNHALGGAPQNADAPALAIELIHSYSLVHDDLPAMDDADTRRGKPSCHKVYGEAMAVLAGDALQTLAFQVLAQDQSELDAEQRLKMVNILSVASGADGMAGGQALDILGTVGTLGEVEHLYHLKTGALLTASVRLGMTAATIQNVPELVTYAEDLGLAFQIHDDLLDFESNEETLGKPQGLDVINKKITYPSLAGITGSKQKITELTQSALAAIEDFGTDGDILRQLAAYLLHRKY